MINNKSMNLLKLKAETIAQKIRHHLITMMGKSCNEANNEEFYYAFCTVLRKEIMMNWIATTRAFKKQGVRKLYYFSMEYMPGRLFENSFINIGAIDLMKAVLVSLKRNFHTISHIEPDIGIGNGGLGRLASCFLDSLATLQYPAMGYGIRYQYGIFEQELMCGVQIERPDCWLLNCNPWEIRQDSRAVSVGFGGTLLPKKNSHGDEVYDLINCEEVRVLPYDFPIVGYSHHPNFSVLTLRLWSTKESPHNFKLQRYNAGDVGQARENTGLTDVLYPNDNNEVGKRTRLKQEFLLTSASLQDIVNQYHETYPHFDAFSDTVRIQINDTHPTLIIPELIRLLTRDKDIAWEDAWEIVRTCCSYTNHTILKEALEEWNINRLGELLPCHFSIIQRLNKTFCTAIRQKFPNNEEKVRNMSIIENGQVRMAHLAIYGSHRVNGVAKLHTNILKQVLFKDFHDMYPDRFINITNGITQRRWLLHCNPLLTSFLKKRIGNGWITHFEELKQIANYANDLQSQQEFLEIKKQNKERFLTMMREDMFLRHGFGKEFTSKILLESDALFDVQIKRIHEYKRQLYYEIKENPHSHQIKRFAIFGGKAAPGYQTAKDIIRLIYCLARKVNNDPDVQDKLKIVFIENYNVSRAEILIPATDLSEQISTSGMEASGTGNMKLTINGALTIATDDGANIEMRKAITNEKWPFVFGTSFEENIKMFHDDHYHPLDIYEQNPQVKRVIDALINGSLVENEAEHAAIHNIYHRLFEKSAQGITDQFFVVNDLMAYHETHKKVEALYQEPLKWAQYAIYNIAGMGQFSSDISIKNYAKNVWDLKPCPPDRKQLHHIRKES